MEGTDTKTIDTKKHRGNYVNPSPLASYPFAKFGDDSSGWLSNWSNSGPQGGRGPFFFL